MKNRSECFFVRFLAVLLLGLLFLLAHNMTSDPITAVFVPQIFSPWEMSKLAFWPLLIGIAISGPLSGGAKKTLRALAPWLVIAPIAVMLIFWGLNVFHPSPAVYLLAWVVAMALVLALAQTDILGDKDGKIWVVLACIMALLYVVLTFLPPMAGPFLDPSDVAAMATIPY